ncbi:AfsR/SARP family transcriptional regulator [Streptomyces radicis]|uniref:SARP family transcriptional regulator n=1 Tax=Streptomyces radicis TaxID=1750517 RepID=A0A3A9W701_9ACTN|nr:BTAD domain-containing putative transcriptional regulator [Streptomyces radicis]RKN08589.1 SARP family transcriptional regulator [Streptomyces radicis]RKN21747.1 SARP family transcriptional regulator [Streptomyces radicis]
MRVEFRLLGPVGARVDGRPVEVGPARQRWVLAALLADVNAVVVADRLVDRVWGEDAPRQASGTLRSHVSRLRSALAEVPGCAIGRRGGGYVLETDEQAVDIRRFRALLARARAVADAGERDALYREALALWEGEALAGLDTPWAMGVRHRLATERLVATLDHHDLLLERGEHAALLPEAEALAAEHPLDERLAGQLILALYRAGRQADALERYERLRRRLAEELGADPSPTLRAQHRDILGAAEAPPPPPIPARLPQPRQLPAPPGSFSGRERELAVLDAAVAAGAVAAIGGSGGVGKSWLALHWAHRNQRAFPDGQLYVNLRGFDPSGTPLPSGAAVRTFLDALGVDPAVVPADLDAQAALYRGLVADRRMLVVLDNARDSAQVEPLLPGGSTCAVLVTSRHQLAGLVTGHGARPVPLEVLEGDAALRLLTRHLADRGIAVAGQEAALAELVGRCAGLPLALAVVAARAAMRPGFPLSVLAEELREDATRLDALDAGESAANPRAVFSWSYGTLSPGAARLFRLLALAPGPDIGRAAAASLAGLPPAEVRAPLAELARAHLISEPVPGRWTFHDLLRAYAAERAREVDPPGEREAALRRVLDHCVRSAHAAALRFYPQRQPIEPVAPAPCTTPVVPETHEEATAWLTAEHAVLMAAARRAAEAGHAAHAWQLAWALGDFLDLKGHWHDQRAVQEVALAAAERAGDRLGAAHAHQGLARAAVRLGRDEEARGHPLRALALYEELGDEIGQARTHHMLGWVLERQGRTRESLAHTERGLALFRRTGQRSGTASALNGVGWLLTLLGDHEGAVAHCEEALRLHEELGNVHGQAATSDSLGLAHHHLGRHGEAIAWYRNALPLYRRVGDRYREGATLLQVGDSQRAAGDLAAARASWRAALAVLDELGHADAEGARARLREDHAPG